jgi:hypothetical protein
MFRDSKCHNYYAFNSSLQIYLTYYLVEKYNKMLMKLKLLMTTLGSQFVDPQRKTWITMNILTPCGGGLEY